MLKALPNLLPIINSDNARREAMDKLTYFLAASGLAAIAVAALRQARSKSPPLDPDVPAHQDLPGLAYAMHHAMKGQTATVTGKSMTLTQLALHLDAAICPHCQSPDVDIDGDEGECHACDRIYKLTDQAS
jgi:hypothetical protein